MELLRQSPATSHRVRSDTHVMARASLLAMCVTAGLLLSLGACGHAAQYAEADGIGESPVLPLPTRTWIPTVNVVTAKGWRSGEVPRGEPGTRVTAFAGGLTHPRWLYVLPNGDVLVAETNAPPKPGGGIRAWLTRRMQKKAGGAVPSPNRITLLRDADGDGVAEFRTTFLRDLHSPFGMALIDAGLFVANTDAIVRFPYHTGDTAVTVAGTPWAALPAGPVNHHWTKSLIASPDGTRLYAGVGSNSDHGERGLAAEEGRAAIWEFDVATARGRVFASGLRNPVGLAWEPQTGTLWTAVNERDELGSDLVPDYLTAVRDGAFYGWPYSYFGGHLDERVEPQRPDLVRRALRPDYALGAHTASLGLAWFADSTLASPRATGMFVGQHGSWNRKPRSGYKVVFVPFANGRPAGDPIDVLTGFVNAKGEASGRPVGVAIDARGGLLVADDVGNTVWRVTYERQPSRSPDAP